MAQVYILSKMANSVTYRTYTMRGDKSQKAGLLPMPDPNPITIKGGAERPSQRGGFGDVAQDISGNVIWTPRGVVTTLSQEDYDRLKGHALFQKHMEGGYLAVVTSDVANNHKKVSRIAEDMEGQDRALLLKKETIAQRIKVNVPTFNEVSQER